MRLVYRRSPTGKHQVHALWRRCEAIGVHESRAEAAWSAIRRLHEAVSQHTEYTAELRARRAYVRRLGADYRLAWEGMKR